jgi:hypothetical protein
MYTSINYVCSVSYVHRRNVTKKRSLQSAALPIILFRLVFPDRLMVKDPGVVYRQNFVNTDYRSHARTPSGRGNYEEPIHTGPSRKAYSFHERQRTGLAPSKLFPRQSKFPVSIGTSRYDKLIIALPSTISAHHSHH